MPSFARVAWPVNEMDVEYVAGFGDSGVWFGSFRTDAVGMNSIVKITIRDWCSILSPSLKGTKRKARGWRLRLPREMGPDLTVFVP